MLGCQGGLCLSMAVPLEPASACLEKRVLGLHSHMCCEDR